MKVDLEKLHLNMSELTNEVFVGTIEPKNKNLWKNKKDVTNEFIACVIQKWKGHKQEFTSRTDGKKYEISVKEIK